ncbi:MAG: DUF2934 domain-containing protein [Cellvibrio sp.]|uniref:DUF2934 domain-containing protein n=1 Tax=Cellvibrio sp. TaxID=1965322 RepID=UPI0031A441E5
MKSNEERIRELAYQMWEADGKPEGLSKAHWQHATEVVEEANRTDQRSPKKSIDPSEKRGSIEPEQPDQT